MGEDLWVSIYEILGNIKGRIMGEGLWGKVYGVMFLRF
jgi:hypothetical protein